MPPWVAWLDVVVVLAAALIGVLMVALHYRREATMLQWERAGPGIGGRALGRRLAKPLEEDLKRWGH